MKRIGSIQVFLGTCSMVLALVHTLTAVAVVNVSSLAELRNNSDLTDEIIVLAPGEYWIDGDHIANPTSSEPIFLELSGNGNTYDLSQATIKLDTRELDGFGRGLGHDSAVRPIKISGSNNTVTGLTLIGEDIDLTTDPDAQRHADWGTTYVQFTGDDNSLINTYVETRGSSPYGLGDAFGKGSSQGMSPYIGHRKAAGIQVLEATNAYFNNIDLDINTYGHGFFVQKSSDTTFENGTITGELAPSSNVINHSLYQQYGHTWWGGPIHDNIMISAAEDGLRAYGTIDGVSVTNMTVRNVVVTNMRTGFATAIAKGNIVLENVESYGGETNFAVGGNHTITNAKGDITNGPLFNAPYNNVSNTTVDVELVGGPPVGMTWNVGYITGDNVDVTVSSSLPAGALPDDSFVRSGQVFYQDWRDWQTTDPDDDTSYDLINSSFTNNTNQIMVMGVEVTGNTGSSQAPVISNGKENYYDAVTWVPTGERLTVQHENGMGNGGNAPGATFDSNGTVVFDGATLEIQPDLTIDDERVTITGDGVDGQGAIYTDGAAGSGTRLVASGGASTEIIVLDGDASIGVGVPGNQFLVSRIAGVGNLTKRGSGLLSMQKSNTLDGDFIVAEGSVEARTNTIRHGLTLAPGTSIHAIGDMLNAADGVAQVDGMLDLNGRIDNFVIPGVISLLNGSSSGQVTSSNPIVGAGGTLELAGNSESGVFSGTIDGLVNLVKSGTNSQSLDGTMTHTGATTVSAGKLLINGTHVGGDSYTVDGGTLGGNGTIDANITVESGGTLSPGTSPGQLTVGDIEFEMGSVLEIELGGKLAGTDFDVLLGDSFTLGGDLNISLVDLGGGLFRPAPSDTFTVMDGISLTGVFDNVASGQRIDTAGGEGSFLVSYVTPIGALILSDFAVTSIPGDFNGDGRVDALDFLEWQRDPGIGNLSDWETNYGFPTEATMTAVPEPATLLLALVVTTITLSRRRSRSR